MAFYFFVQSLELLECYIGTQGDEQLTECPDDMDRCAYAITGGSAMFTCMNSSVMTRAGFTNNACSTLNYYGNTSVTMCICDTAGCNKEFNDSK